VYAEAASAPMLVLRSEPVYVDKFFARARLVEVSRVEFCKSELRTSEKSWKNKMFQTSIAPSESFEKTYAGFNLHLRCLRQALNRWFEYIENSKGA
jgi:hypothetical protein